ncbi:UNVERIFIED_ORG: hypothetical protein B2H98_12585 [Clostridium botulinum]|uniref:Uncharacterized protein n=1 Tax=Clostridium botulinum TaxID=1491 RepID=A0A6M0SR06_CLOBO|nr:hypothetical protein [Clostridium botulinum]
MESDIGMNEELKVFLKSKAKETPQGGYTFVLEEINFSVIEMPSGISLQYNYINKREVIEPTEIILDKNILTQEFCEKLVEIVGSIKKYN